MNDALTDLVRDMNKFRGQVKRYIRWRQQQSNLSKHQKSLQQGEDRYLLQLGETRDKSGQSNEEVMVRLRMMFRSFNLENIEKKLIF